MGLASDVAEGGDHFSLSATIGPTRDSSPLTILGRQTKLTHFPAEIRAWS
jgi:hypothetical protein